MALFFSPDDDSSISDSSWPRVDVIRLKITPFLIALAAFLLSLVAACGTLNENENGSESESNALAAEHRQSVLSALPVTPRGKRILAMDVGPGQGETLDAALAKAKSAGITTVVLNYDWVDIEPTPLTYQHARLTTDNTYYSTAPHDASVVLNIRPIAGACRRVPPDLTNVAWDDPVMITRFHYLLYWIWSHLPHLTVHAMSIGTEVDAHFAPDGYAAYKTFFEAARMNAQRYWGAALPVGVTTTWDALTTPGPTQDAILDLNEHADHVLYTYYGVGADFMVKDPYLGPVNDTYAAIMAVDSHPKTRGRLLSLIEAGYPTSLALLSSDPLQAVFVATIFGVWDAYATRLNTIVFTWEVDLSEDQAQWVAIGPWRNGACSAPAGLPPAPPGAPTVTPRGTGGSRAWEYYIVAMNASGNSLPGPKGHTVVGNATLSPRNYNRITWAGVPGATRYKVMRYRVGGTPRTTGLIATTTSTTLNDTGLNASTYILQEFIRTLGYRTHPSPVNDKPAFVQIATEAHARGW